MKHARLYTGVLAGQLPLPETTAAAPKPRWHWIYVLNEDNFNSVAFSSPVPPPQQFLESLPDLSTGTDVFVYGAENVPAALRAMQLSRQWTED